MFAWHKVPPTQVGSRPLEIYFLRLHIEFDRPVRFTGEPKSFHSCVGDPRDLTAVSSIVRDQQPATQLGVGDVLGEVCEALDDPFKVVVDVQMIFFNIQNGGVFGAVGMKRAIEFAGLSHH